MQSYPCLTDSACTIARRTAARHSALSGLMIVVAVVVVGICCLDLFDFYFSDSVSLKL